MTVAAQASEEQARNTRAKQSKKNAQAKAVQEERTSLRPRIVVS
jgi:hypothetical protein